MNCVLTLFEDMVEVQMRVESDVGDTGDASVEVTPGDTFFGWTYAELRALGDGEHTLEAKS